MTPFRILAASLAGTAIEFYDFYIYATAASLVFGPLFFPAADTSTQLLAAYGSFAVAFVARPIGAIAFGHFGDRLGRKSTLIASLLTMGGATILIGVLPTYAVLGWGAPLLLCILRFGQGFGLGGEWGGAALLAVENAPEGYRGRYGMMPQMGAPLGYIAANGLFLILGLWLSASDFQEWGWRLPFLLSVFLIGIGLWVRLKIAETPEFAAVLRAKRVSKVPLADLFRGHALAMLCATATVVACFAIFYLATAFALGYGTANLGYDRRSFLAVQLLAIPFLALGIGLAGHFSDRRGPRRVLMAGCLFTFAVGGALAPMMGSGSLAVIGIFLSAALFVMGFVYGPLGAFLPSLFPPELRYSGISVAFNLGGILGGGLAPILAQALANRGGLAYVGFYLATAALISLAGLMLINRPSPFPR